MVRVDLIVTLNHGLWYCGGASSPQLSNISSNSVTSRFKPSTWDSSTESDPMCMVSTAVRDIDKGDEEVCTNSCWQSSSWCDISSFRRLRPESLTWSSCCKDDIPLDCRGTAKSGYYARPTNCCVEGGITNCEGGPNSVAVGILSRRTIPDVLGQAVRRRLQQYMKRTVLMISNKITDAIVPPTIAPTAVFEWLGIAFEVDESGSLLKDSVRKNFAIVQKCNHTCIPHNRKAPRRHLYLRVDE